VRILALLLLPLTGCVTTTPAPTLYTELGGTPALTLVVDNFIDEIGRDEQILAFFKDTDVERFRRKMFEHLCRISDGPCTYTGDSMLDVHANMGVTETAFNRTVDLLVSAMTRAGISHPLQNRILQRLAPLRSEIIYITR
jgi:hemoglobin